MTKTIIIRKCGECPYFREANAKNNWYRDYCNKDHNNYFNVEKDIIPENCPLNDLVDKTIDLFQNDGDFRKSIIEWLTVGWGEKYLKEHNEDVIENFKHHY